MPNFCPKCGTKLDEDKQKFCKACGTPINGGKKTPKTPQVHHNRPTSQQNAHANYQAYAQGNYMGTRSQNTPQLNTQKSYVGAYYDAPSVKQQKQDDSITKEERDSSIYQKFFQSEEYNPDWLDPGTQALKIPENDEALMRHWTELAVKKERSLGHSFRVGGRTMLWFGFYALISFVVFDGMSTPMDAAMQALFLPLMFYIYGSYKRFDKYIKAILYSGLVLFVVLVPLYQAGLISWRGIPFILPVLFLEDLIPGAAQAFLSQIGTTSLAQGTIQVILLTFIVEFVLLLIYWVVKKQPKIEIVLSRRALFIRAKSVKSWWENFKLFFWVLVNPFNVAAIKDLRDRIKYNKMSSKEGKNYDFARIPAEAILELSKKENKIAVNVIISVVLGYVGFAISFFPFVLIAIVLFIKTMRYKDTWTVTIHFDRERVEGSWAKVNDTDILKFVKTNPEVAEFFQPMSRGK